jgi:hypothetical protein
MRPSYDFLPAEEREWVERCQSLAVVVLLVVLALFAGFAFAQAADDPFVAAADRIGPFATSEQRGAI